MWAEMPTRTGMDINWWAIRSDICTKVNVPCVPSRTPGWAEQPDPHLAAKTEAQEAWDFRSGDREVGKRPNMTEEKKQIGVKSLVFVWIYSPYQLEETLTDC